MVSYATNLSGRVNDKVSDLINIAQKEQLLLKEEMVSITTNLSGKVEKINDLLTTTQTEQRLLWKEISSIITKFDTLDQMNKDEIKILNKSENVVDDMENLQTKMILLIRWTMMK